MILMIKNETGNVTNVSAIEDISFDNMEEALVYLKDTFELDGIIKIWLK